MKIERVEILNNQHSEILDTIKKISAELTDQKVSQHAPRILAMLAALYDTLEFHLTDEDQSLYPQLLLSPDRQIRELALRYTEDAGSLLEIYRTYLDVWSDTDIIRRSPEEFIHKTEQVISLLLDRIYIEDNILFPRIRSMWE